MSDTLALASLVATLDRSGLTELVRARRVFAPNSVNDALDLAGELLKPESIVRALTELTSAELVALARFSLPAESAIFTADHPGPSQSDPLVAQRFVPVGLVGRGPAPLAEVATQLQGQFAAHGVTLADLESPIPSPASDGAGERPDTSGWFTAALTTTSQIAWILRDLGRTPARLNRNGGIASAWVKSTEERLGLTRVADLVDLMRAAKLTADEESALVAHADVWLASGHEARWIALARSAVELMPSPVLALLADAREGEALSSVVDAFPARYPFTPQSTFDTIERAAALWEQLGITVQGRFSEAGVAAICAVPEASGLGFPAVVPGVYIQPDLSVIVPGLLPASDEAALAELALPEQIGVASTLRFTEASLGDAFDRGVDVATIRGILKRLSLTGIPQPLDYLISALAARAGSITVSISSSDAGRTRIDFARSEVRTTVLVDRSLAHLQLREADGGAVPASDPAPIAPLFSRLRADHVLAALVDARYPATAGDAVTALGARHPATRTATTTAAAPATTGTEDPLAALVDRVLEAAQHGPSDIGRQVTLAIRDKSAIRVTVEIRGHTRDFTILPISLAAGRMRALDEAAGVERTLPIDAITAVSQLV